MKEKLGEAVPIRNSVSVLLPDLRPGGAEKLHVHLAHEWRRRGISVEFVLRRARGELLSALPDGVGVFALEADRVRSTLWPLVNYLRTSPPSALLAVMWPLTIVAPIAARLACYQGRSVISEHSPLSLAYASYGRAHRMLLRGSTRVGYRLADVRIAVSAGVADDLASISGLPRERFQVIHNAAAIGRVAEPAPMPVELRDATHPLVLTVGTLKRVKRHDLLIDAFARLLADRDATLCIVGEGPERPALTRQVAALGLEGKVLMPGQVSDPGPWYANADVFVLASDYEGFGNVLVEALEHGLPVVSTDCPSGPSEILDCGQFGRLVPPGDAASLACAVAASLRDPPDRESLKRRARDFAVGGIGERYLDLLLPDWRRAAT